MIDLLALGRHIKARRKDAGMTQRELADACGVDFTYISKIENGRIESAPSRVLLVRIADCLGDERDVLIDLAGQRTKAELQAEIVRLSAMTTESKKQTVEISGVYLRRIGKTIDVLVERDGVWVRVIREIGDGPISHICEPLGIVNASADEQAAG